ncbi:MAG TPA: DNA topoisomerase IV subunit A [Sediminispirochaeta sp.]|nr:DNA topoisomerase IV subunit A [Sediminispirochaeta sp.]
MPFVKNIFDKNFLEYASYVIKDRAIPDVKDGLKPVQRRILHSLLEVDDGKFHKVANVVGSCMKYHPHGDASIYSALVGMANKELFIDKQGNFGNLFTGDEASAARYIECRIKPFAKKVLYSPEITEYTDSYDGRNKEPVVFPAKIPVVLIQGAEGIAVGMSTKILPHNFHEVLGAVKAALRGEEFELFPDFPGGGLVDVSDYQDGRGKVLVRAKLDTSDPKRIVIRELPFGSTTESLIASIEAAARKNKFKIASIYDYTTEEVEIEIKLARGEYSSDVVDALYAFTDCEYAISVNPLVIKENVPTVMSVTEIIRYHAGQLVKILEAELKVERGHLRDRLHARTLERIFIEERIYKQIEEMTTQEAVMLAVFEGFEPFKKEIPREITREDIERLLKIPIRRISLYDINKNRQEVEEIKGRLKEIKHHLEQITDYAVSFIDEISTESRELFPRRTKVGSFEKTDVREAAQRNLELRYDGDGGYLGYEVRGGKALFAVNQYDRVLVIRKNGIYSVIDVPDKLFVDKGMLFCGLADKEELAKYNMTLLYKNEENGGYYIKRFKIEQFIIGKTYELLPKKAKVLDFTVREDEQFLFKYKKKPRLKVLEESFAVADYLVKSVRAQGVRLTTKETRSIKRTRKKKK